MWFDKLDIENFAAIERADVSLREQGLVSVSGVNLDDTSADSNGSGKSSLVDALFWCLYGSTSSGMSGDEVVLEGSNGTKVTTILGDDTETWRITRYRKYPKYRNALTVEQLVEGEWVDRTKGTNSLTQELVNTVVGASETVFKSAVYSGQENMPDLPKMTDKNLKLIVEEAAGIDILDAAYAIAREDRSHAETVVAEHQIAHDKYLNAARTTRDRLESVKQDEKSWAKNRESVIKRASATVDECKQALADAEADYSEEAVKKLELAEEKIERTLKKAMDQSSMEAKLEAEQKSARRAVQSAKEAVEVFENNVRRANADLRKVDEKVGTPCPECGQPLTKNELASLRESAQERLREVEERLANAKDNLKKCIDEEEEARKKLAEHQAGMVDYSEVIEKRNRIREKLKFYERISISIVRNREQVEAAEQALKREEKAENPYSSMIKKLEEELKSQVKILKEEKKKLEAAQEELEYANEVVNIYGPKGVRSHILDIVTPFLNERTAHYLGSLSDGNIEAYWTTQTLSKDGKTLREQFSIMAQKSTGASSFAGLSGGEKRKVRLACALALQDLVASRATKPINLWIGDEIDDALDDSGIERLMVVLEEKAREHGTVLIISHNDIKHFARRSWVVKRKNAKSTVDTSVA